MFSALYLEKDIQYNFDPNKSPENEAETEILIVYYISTALEILGLQPLFALIS